MMVEKKWHDSLPLEGFIAGFLLHGHFFIREKSKDE